MVNLNRFSVVNFTGFCTDGAAGVYTLEWTISNSYCMSSNSSVSLTVMNTGTWFGSSNNWYDANNWCGGVPTITSDLSISSTASNMPLISGTGVLCRNITINSGASLTMDNTADLTVYGNWSNYGTFNPGGGMVTFGGNSSQSVTGATNYDNMYVNNPSGVFLNNNITINSVLELDTGNIITGSNLVQINPNAYPIAIGGYIDGNLKQYIPNGFFESVSYPIGKGTKYSPIDLTFDNVYTDGYITASTSNGDETHVSVSGFNPSQTVNRIWSVVNNGISFDQYSIGLSYPPSDKDAGFVDSYASSKIYAQGNWLDLSNGANYINYQTEAGVTNFGNYQIGTINPTPSLYSLSSYQGNQSQTLNLVFTGAGFIPGATTINVGSGITVNSAIVNVDTMLTANISISPTATTGIRLFSVTNGAPGGGTSGTVNFMIVKPLPTLDSLTPSQGFAGQSMYVSFHGTGFIAGLSTVNLGPDISLYSLTVNSDTILTAHIVVSLSATLGLRPFSVTNGGVGGGTSGTANFLLLGPLPVANFSANTLIIPCNTNGTVTFNNLSSYSTGYLWDFGSGAIPATATGAGPHSVNYSTSGLKTVKLVVTNSNGIDSLTKTNFITVNSLAPTSPLSISGLASLCSNFGTNAVYTCPTVASATGYLWTIPSGITYISGQGSTSLTVRPTSAFSTGTLYVASTNGCGTSSGTASLNLDGTAYTLTGTISGPSVVCGINSATYTVSSILGATSYNWTVPSGITIVSGQGTTSLTVNIGAGTITGNISVTAINPCGNSSLSMAITKKPPLPTSILGSTSLCGSSTASFSVSPVNGATSYTWTLPTGVTVSTGAGTSLVNVNVLSTFVSGNISVIAVNTCGSLGSLSETVYGKAPSVAPTSISGPSNICGITTTTYTAAAVAGATGYFWTLPSGINILSGTGTSTITVSNNSYSSGNISVAATNSCGTGASRSLALTVAATAPLAISGANVTCGLASASYSILPVAGSIGYNWTVPAGVSISSGIGTTGITVSFTTPPSGNISVTSSNGCVNSTARVFPISKATPIPGAITGAVSGICSLGTSTYSIAAVGGSTGYSWLVPAGMTILSGQGTTSISASVTGTMTTGNVKVSSQNTCGSSASVSLAVTCASPTAISNPAEPTNNTFSESYPNPSNGLFTIDIISDKDSELIMEIYDILGNLIKRDIYLIKLGEGQLKANIEDHKAGIYLVRIMDNENNILNTQRVIKE